MNNNHTLIALYRDYVGQEPASIEPLTKAGSNRAYYRLWGHDGRSVVGVTGTSQEENHAFITLTRHFTEKQLPVPRILAVSDDEMHYLQTDLGTRSLYEAIRHGREHGGDYSEEEKELLKKTIRRLPEMQLRGGEGLDYSVCYPQPEFDEEGIMFDLNYFKYCFLKTTGIDFHEVRLQRDFQKFAKLLLSAECRVQSALHKAFLYRDFQARNVMLTADGEPRFIDYQGGRRGPVYYDVASFLWQASARYPKILREELIEEYYDALVNVLVETGRLDGCDDSVFASLKEFKEQSLQEFKERLRLFVLFRLLQVLGAYGFRGRFERKQYFIDSIPPALNNLKDLLDDGPEFPFPELMKVLRQLAQTAPSAPEERQVKEVATATGPVKSPALVVRVCSFSYKKGIPVDESGNGGGYVFDCRSTHNPGRYEPYKKLTGRDEEVIKFLEDDGEILTFLESVCRLADVHVARYIQRGFNSLMFCFGCTGGQHRSVYCAEHLAEHIHKKFGVEVRLCHREQGISRVLSVND